MRADKPPIFRDLYAYTPYVEGGLLHLFLALGLSGCPWWRQEARLGRPSACSDKTLLCVRS